MNTSEKRLIVTGFPCPASAWQNFIPHDVENVFLPFVETLSGVKKLSFYEMAKYVASRITAEQPTHLICHDYGVVITLLALLRLKKKEKLPQLRVTVLNGAFRGLDVFKATHPFKIQLLSWKRFTKVAEQKGAHVDPGLGPFFSSIKGLYLKIIAHSLITKSQGLFKKTMYQFDLGIPMQTIISENDPFIPKEAMNDVVNDFGIRSVHHINYGHFPYSSSGKDKVIDLIKNFQDASVSPPKG